MSCETYLILGREIIFEFPSNHRALQAGSFLWLVTEGAKKEIKYLKNKNAACLRSEVGEGHMRRYTGGP